MTRPGLVLLVILGVAAASDAQVQTTVSYTYDALDRLIEVRYPTRVVRYTYDVNGNQTAHVVETLNAPAIAVLTPSAATFGDPAFTLQVTGTGFTAGAEVRWNGVARTTTFVSATELRAAILPADLGAGGVVWVTVVGAGESGGASDPLPFTIAKAASTTTAQFHDAAHQAIASTFLGAPVHLAASVPGTASGPAPTGEVTFTVYPSANCTGTGSPGGAAFVSAGIAHASQTTAVPRGGLSARAAYPGDALYLPSESGCVAIGEVPPAFTDSPLVARTTAVKAVHVAELRDRIDELRGRYGLGPYAWTDPRIEPRSTLVKVDDLRDLRTAIDEVYTAAKRTPPTYAEPTITGRTTVVAAAHLAEIRAAILAIW